ncbi:uncharacterized protein EHS24_001834 [Apiotrichum porosum]|uniref:Glucosamine 6-phosphate N-acetyltransferase n=1 Tax=Apiotrichum porosum TaxID=105984 RepID=A0A427XJ43_9TREE|nr:uncharacterized protein EHS24_001834 [Apiotrichum porosum]RSH78911.1 hypothetical protein EHS24_001834 [Apiotrichum porosum]
MAPATSELLFPREIIPVSIQQRLGPDLEIRPLASSDHSRGHFELLSVLSQAPALTKEHYEAQFASMKACLNTYYTVVFVNKATDQLVAVGSIFVERKFLRGGGIVGHIEDIAVSKSMQGRKLGLHLINALEEIGRNTGCYKIILDCSKENIPFYEKCGFTHKEYEMVMYLNQPLKSRM